MGFGTDGVTVHSFSGNERVVLSKFSWRQLDRIFFEVHVFLTCSHGNMVTSAIHSPLESQSGVFPSWWPPSCLLRWKLQEASSNCWKVMVVCVGIQEWTLLTFMP